MDDRESDTPIIMPTRTKKYVAPTVRKKATLPARVAVRGAAAKKPPARRTVGDGDNARVLLTGVDVSNLDLERWGRRPVLKGLSQREIWRREIVILALIDRLETVATVDPHDRAHNQQDEDGFLRPSADEWGGVDRGLHSTPRRYCHVVATPRGPVGTDSMFDEWHEARRRLESAAIVLPLRLTWDAMLEGIMEVRPGNTGRLRDLLAPRTRQKMSTTESQLLKEGTRWIQQHKRGNDSTTQTDRKDLGTPAGQT